MGGRGGKAGGARGGEAQERTSSEKLSRFARPAVSTCRLIVSRSPMRRPTAAVDVALRLAGLSPAAWGPIATCRHSRSGH